VSESDQPNDDRHSVPASWPETTREVYEGLRTYRIVGASACVTAIMRALQTLATHLAARPDGSPYKELEDAGAHFCALKPDTAAYVNAVRWLLAGLDNSPGSEAIASTVAQRAAAYAAYSRASLGKIVDEACRLLPANSHILIHDYSSTVLAVVAEAGRRRLKLRVYVTAGEPVAQGPRVARLAADAGHHVVYLPDSGIGRVMPEVNIVLSGVETLFRNGDLANTVGTYPIALVAREQQVPFYGLTERMKIHSGVDAVTLGDLRAEVLHPWPRPGTDLPPGTDVRRQVLDLTPARLVTGYVTEEGETDPAEVSGAIDRLYAEQGS
jgi:translation initiation factor 2B subunit (eIF-2B alpha/beta/delta family)